MTRVFLYKESEDIKEILNDTYDELFAALKYKAPEALSLVDDDDLSMLHDLYALIKTGYIHCFWLSGEDEACRYLAVKIDEKPYFNSS